MFKITEDKKQWNCLVGPLNRNLSMYIPLKLYPQILYLYLHYISISQATICMGSFNMHTLSMYTVMLVGVTNAPTIFQHVANNIFHNFLIIFTIVSLNDIVENQAQLVWTCACKEKDDVWKSVWAHFIVIRVVVEC